MTPVRLRRLQSDFEQVQRAFARHARIAVVAAEGNPPEKYTFEFRVRSLIATANDSFEEGVTHRAEVFLPAEYPRRPPFCRMITPVFHPNIDPQKICIGDHWTASESLDVLIQRVGEILAFQSYNTKSPLNGRAAQWIDEHRDQLPVDPDEFFVDLAAAPAPAPAERTAQQTACSNCGARGGELVACRVNHQLSADCVIVCRGCDKVVCLACGETKCRDCAAV